jgi:hypothetical protein
VKNDSKFIVRNMYRIVGVVVAVIVVGAAVSLFFWGPFSVDKNSEKQLNLIANEDENTIHYSQNITIRMEVYNAGSTAIFNVSNLWPTIGGVKDRLGISPCSFEWPFGFAVVPGYITNSSLISAKPLDMWAPGPYMCPAINAVNAFRINGSSDSGFMLTPGNSPIPITLSSSLTFSGYWTENSTINGQYKFVHFAAGQYTIIVADEWGAINFLHFQVMPLLP